MRKNLFLFLLAIIAGTSSLWASDIEVDGIYYAFNDYQSTATVTYRGSSYNSYSNEYSGDVVIPSSVNYNDRTYSVTIIDNSTFYNCTSLTSVTIPNTVTSIRSYAFYQCEGLLSVTIGNSVTSIGQNAFTGCNSLTEVTIPNSVTSIADYAFEDCSMLASVTLGNSVASIGMYAFSGCSLTSVTIPNSITSIGRYAFSNCSNLTQVTLNSNSVVSNNYSSGGTSYMGEFFGNQVTEFIIGEDVTSIGNYAFYSCPNMTSLIIGENVTSIGSYAFYGCTGLTSVTIPNNVTSIDGAFAYCSGLTSIIIPNSVTSIDGAFEYCSGLTSVTLPNSITNIGDNTFSHCSSLAEISIPNSVTSIGGHAFSSCTGLTAIAIPNSVTSIEVGAFSNCSNMTEITIGNSVTSIGYAVFNNCSSLSKVNISDIAAWCNIFFHSYESEKSNPLSYAHHLYFNDEEITELVIPNNVPRINSYAFCGCSSLTSVTIPSSVTFIGSNAFKDCSSLSKVNISDIAAWCNISFGSAEDNPLSYAHHLYFEDEEITDLIIPNTVAEIKKYVFYGCSSLVSVAIPSSVTSIAKYAFKNCSNLTSVIWNAKHCADFEIGYSPFYHLPVTSFVFGEEVEHIPSNMCEELSGLTSIVIPESVTSIGEGAFFGCTGLSSIVVPENVTTIHTGATFQECTGLTSVQWNAKNCTIESYGENNYYPPFFQLSSITQFVLGEEVESIPADLCYDMAGLDTIVIPSRVNSIGTKAFGSCSGLKEVTCLAVDLPVLGDEVFANVDCSQIPLLVPAESWDAYTTADQWKEFSPITPIGSIDTSIQNMTSVENALSDKILRDGQILILRGEKTYTLQGQEVK